jgi:small GTP-binding protein
MFNAKVVLYGKSEAGKSTLVSQLIPDAVNISHEGRTTAMDYGTFRLGEVSYHLFGTPGQPHFRPVREVISQGMDAAIFVIDSTRCLDHEDGELLKELHTAKVPYVVFLNQKPEKTEQKSKIESFIDGFVPPFRIVVGSAKTGEGVQELMKAIKGSVALRPKK